MPRHENLSEVQISKLLLELDEEWEEDSSDSFYCSEDYGEKSKDKAKSIRTRATKTIKEENIIRGNQDTNRLDKRKSIEQRSNKKKDTLITSGYRLYYTVTNARL
ncbi:Hypothetical predicted protein [Octopus vulgaris]|uniref:Uncharacterized protein n=1 Tax=Octopus vulgaris TaxID=6645 RepID=A0AA36F2V3_OCTVU|nr:Hypothetical predicted protein [Octopus vulgaris]